ncbi:Aldehyde dehydrogenase N-terminal [Penicillium cf. griseofulvum]|uniref:Aldehyde dehydrogenase N-terminal n=1 Tax=Penicillium cf. griseofulvum TaxID=2972120 RepID=A0A9W9T584_9EURO|nr:Aldehyde dehydrogenase N-terminal [Penicillium cf. griseofulvum]KAJ5421370.1 Aldehyde dehydrogenase N-terminal [Penicillium cf. griseofulvum]KAJ5424605.1 Aldehyde dehydrogenase N-terminal [Penicillium cf. griseofulvum]
MTIPTNTGLTVPLIINGHEETTPKTFPVTSPYTNTTIWTASAATPQDAIRAVEAADAAFPSWSQTKPTVRRDILLKAANILEARLDTNAEYMRQEMGADIGASAGFVVPLGVRMLREVASRITSICGSVPVVETEGQSAIIYKEAMGVILGIVPWNAPYVFGIRSAACALAAGNTTVLKSSEITPRCYWAIGRAFEDAGLPAGCLNIIHCAPQDAPEVVNAMIEHEAVRKINFTGSTAVGRKIARACGQNLKPCLMELGGKNSSIVCHDADLQTAVQGVLAGAFLNSGQICMATDRILVHTSILPAFIEALQKALAAGAAASALPPTLVNTASKTRVEALIASAISAGAHFISGSADSVPTDSGVRMAPAVLGGVKEDMALWQEESFASVAACMPFDSEEEAIRLANGSGYGLSASVFTEDLRRGLAMAKRIQSGAVHINSMTIHDEPALPHGGVKNSGWGRFNTDEGLNEFLVTKSVTWMD